MTEWLFFFYKRVYIIGVNLQGVEVVLCYTADSLRDEGVNVISLEAVPPRLLAAAGCVEEYDTAPEMTSQGCLQFLSSLIQK